MSLTRIVVVAFLFAWPMVAQLRQGRVSGRVSDSSGAAVSHATVSFYSRSTGARSAASSDESGMYSVALPQGSYLVEAEAAGLRSSGQTVDVDGPKDVPVQLAVGAAKFAIEVTTTGTPQSLDETAKAVDVIDRAELDQRGVESLADGLRDLPGLRVTQRGGPGYFATVQMRGLRTFDTALLIDGMRFRDVGATQGDASSFLSDLLLVDTSRVEVVRGAASSLYGTNAIGGVINMVTDSGGGNFHGSVTADGGGLGEFRGLVRIGGGLAGNRVHYSAGAGHQDVTNGVGGFGRYKNTTGNGLLDYTLRPGLVVSGRLLATDVYGQLYQTASAVPAAGLPTTGYVAAVAPDASQLRLAEQGLPYSRAGSTFIPPLGDPDYYRTARFLSALFAVQQQVSAPFSYRLRYQALLSDRNVVNGPVGAGFQPAFRNSNQFNGRIDTVRAQGNYALGSHQFLSGGYEFEREYFDSPSYDENPNPAKRIYSRTRVSEGSHTVDAQDQIRLLRDRLQISLSGRVQHFGLNKPNFSGAVPAYDGAVAINPANAYTGDASVAYFVRSSGTKVRSHVGNGYRKPSLYELFGTSFFGGSFTAYGDPRLKPERSVAIDAGFDQYFAGERLRVSGTYFYTRLQQVIVFDSSGLVNSVSDPFKRSSGYRNTGGALARGVELSAEVKPIRSTRVKMSYTYTNARDRLSQFVDGTLQTPRTTPHSFGLIVLQQLGKHVDASFEMVAASDFLYQLSRRTFVFPGARQSVLSAGYSRPVTERIAMRIYGRVNNLLDQTYYEDGFRTPRRWAVGGVVFTF